MLFELTSCVDCYTGSRGWLCFFLQVVALLLVVILQALIIRLLLRREVADRASQHIRLPTPQPPRAQGADVCQQAHIKFKDPLSFSGDAKEFKEFAFAMDLALKSLAFQDKSREVDYVAGFLTGNARLWYISSLEAGTSFPSWPSLKQALYLAHAQAMSRRRHGWTYLLSHRPVA